MEHITRGLRYSQLPFSGWKPTNGKLLQGGSNAFQRKCYSNSYIALKCAIPVV
jgi:hypothetical protein